MAFRRTGHIGMSAEAKAARRATIGGSDAKIIMGDDEDALIRLWQEKRGEIEPVNYDENVLIQLGNITEDFNLDLFEHHTGLWVSGEQDKVFCDTHPFMHATLDGWVHDVLDGPEIGIMDAKLMLPFNGWSIGSALEKHWAQLQHNAFVCKVDRVWLSVIKATGGYAWIEGEVDPFYQVEMLRAEERFYECLQSGEVPSLYGTNARAPKPEAIRTVDMSSHNRWADLASRIVETEAAVELNELARKRLKDLFPADAAVAHGHGVKLERSRDGKTLFRVEATKDARAAAKTLIDGETVKPKRSRAKVAA